MTGDDALARAENVTHGPVVRPLPGAGLVCRAGDLLLVCEDGGREADDLLGLVAEVAAAGGDGGLLVRRVAALVAADFDGRFPACAVSGPTRDGRLAVLVYGAATAELVTDAGDISLAGSDAITSVNRLVTGPVTAIRLRLPSAGEPNPRSRLDSGVVAAAGVAWASAGAAPLSPYPMSPPVPSQPVSTFGAAPQGLSSFGPAREPVSSFGAAPEPLSSFGAAPEPVSSFGAAPEPVSSFGAAPEPASSSASPSDSAPSPDSGLPAAPAEASVSAVDGGAAPSASAMDSADVEPVSVVDEARPVAATDTPSANPPSSMDAPAVDGPVVEPVSEADSERLRQPDPAAPFVALLLAPGADGAGGPGPDEPPAADMRPRVLGVLCQNDHFTDASQPQCTVCGTPMDQQTLVMHERPRPPLGLLVLDDGMAFRLDVDYVAGREPQADPEVIAGTVRPLRIKDAEGVVSRRHLRVALSGWEVQVVDLGSANGTFLELPGDEQRHQLAAHQAVVIRPGARVTMGRRWLRYESYQNS